MQTLPPAGVFMRLPTKQSALRRRTINLEASAFETRGEAAQTSILIPRQCLQIENNNAQWLDGVTNEKFFFFALASSVRARFSLHPI
jgi:hypothetical protein